jgi:hypothetical protein
MRSATPLPTMAPRSAPRRVPAERLARRAAREAREARDAKEPKQAARLENIEEWAENPRFAPRETRGGLAVTVYTRKGDEDHYFLKVEAGPGAVPVQLLIDDIDYGKVRPGPTTVLRRIHCLTDTVDRSPSIALRGLD